MSKVYRGERERERGEREREGEGEGEGEGGRMFAATVCVCMCVCVRVRVCRNDHSEILQERREQCSVPGAAPGLTAALPQPCGQTPHSQEGHRLYGVSGEPK